MAAAKQLGDEGMLRTKLLADIVVVEVTYIDFGGKVRLGVIQVHKKVVKDVIAFFERALQLAFPFAAVRLAESAPFYGDDSLLMQGNVTSGFNYRQIAGTDQLSLHSFGRAFDVNPVQNPYVRYTRLGPISAPLRATWDPSVPGTLHADHELVKLMRQRGWEWGGDWTADSGRIDYQHFQLST